MRTLIAGIAVLLIVTLDTSAQDSNAQIKAAVRDVLVRQQDAWNRHDLEAFMSGYWNSPDLTFFSGANVTTGWQATLERYRKRYQNAARTFHAALPQIFGRLEDCPRPHVSGMSYFFNRTCTRAPSGKVPFKIFTTPFATTPSYSCVAALGDSRSTRPMPLSIAALARRSASRLCSRRACSIENQSSWAINCFARE